MAYVFDPEQLHLCAKAGIDLPLEQAFDAVTEELRKRYPRYIHDGPRKWIFNNAGGAMGMLTLLHASITEYVIIFGSSIGTEGHSGRYRADVYDWLFSGEMWCMEDGEPERKVYLPGSQAHLDKSRTKGYRLPEGAWMLEYARGPIVQMLPFGLADSAISTLDYRALGATLAGYTRLTLKSLLMGKI